MDIANNKIAQVTMIVFGVIIVILFLTVMSSFFVDTTATANTSANLTAYPSSEAVLIGAPWYMYFFPVIVGIAAIVGVLRSDK